jgi:hypothetical protein
MPEGRVYKRRATRLGTVRPREEKVPDAWGASGTDSSPAFAEEVVSLRVGGRVVAGRLIVKNAATVQWGEAERLKVSENPVRVRISGAGRGRDGRQVRVSRWLRGWFLRSRRWRERRASG